MKWPRQRAGERQQFDVNTSGHYRIQAGDIRWRSVGYHAMALPPTITTVIIVNIVYASLLWR